MSPRSRRLLAFSPGIAALLVPFVVHAAEPDSVIRLRPHCAETAGAAGGMFCAEFPLYDAETLITQGLKVGDALDLDIVLANPSAQPIQSIQSWLAYDPTVLEGMEIRIADAFPLVAPGEQTFAPDKGLVKIGASNVSGGMRATSFTFAHVTFRVLTVKTDPVRIRFHEFSLLGQEGHTKALLVEEGRTVNVLRTRPSDLLLYFGTGTPPTTLPMPSPSGQPPVTIPPSAGQLPITLPPLQTPPPSAGPFDEIFARLQTHNLRITTEGDRAYLLWSPLSDPRVAGYNIYYGTVSGRYVQRRTVAQETTGVVIRGLPAGKRYYFAVAAFNAAEQESDFSYEVSVVIGDPASSTAPFDLSAFAPASGGTSPEEGAALGGSVLGSGQGGVPGKTGLPVMTLVTIVLCALIGSFTWKRFSAPSRSL